MIEEVQICPYCGKVFNHRIIDIRHKYSDDRTVKFEYRYVECPRCGEKVII